MASPSSPVGPANATHRQSDSSQLEPPAQPTLGWRLSNKFVMGTVGILVRSFMYGLSRAEVHGLDDFTKLLDERADINGRTRGLLTVSNHTSIIDDPLIWGALPFKYLFNAENMRWGLGSHDLCYQSAFTSKFFMYGQTLPAHRSVHSQFGGLFQPSMTQAIRLLSAQPFSDPFSDKPAPPQEPAPPHDNLVDPFTNGSLFYSTNHADHIHSPSAYLNTRHSWVHIFPEGKIHQHPDKIMRYFKWGVARLILESEPAPIVVPIYTEGCDEVYHESRTFPRVLPRPGKKLVTTFGEHIDTEQGDFGEMRKKWKSLVEQEKQNDDEVGRHLGVVTNERLMNGEEARKLREACTKRVRDEVIKLRRSRGLPDEDPKSGLVETWREEGMTGQREGRMADGSWVKDT